MAMNAPSVPQSRAASPRSWTRVVRRVALILVALLLVGYLVIDTIVVLTLTQPTRNPLGADPASYGVAFSDVTFHPRADDSITLSG